MRVEILPKAAQKKCSTGTWLAYWEGFAAKQAGKCSVIGCAEPALTGAQVIKPSLGGKISFIVPMCSGHAEQFGATLDVLESTTFVLANKNG